MTDPANSSLSEPDVPGEAVIQWSLPGWTPQFPFRGNLEFTDDTGDMILCLPLEPMIVRDLRDALTAVLDAQYAAFTQTPAPAASSPAAEPHQQTTEPGSSDSSQEAASSSGYWWSSAFKPNVKPGGLKALVVLVSGVLLLLVFSQILGR